MGPDPITKVAFRLLGEADVRQGLAVGDLIEPMMGALVAFSTGRVVQPHGDPSFFFTSLGLAVEDIAAASLACSPAQQRNLGRVLGL